MAGSGFDLPLWPLLNETRESGYSPILLGHYRNPRNLGDLDGADVVALVREARCGDVLRLAARVRDGRIVEARFKASGCAAAVAVGSRLTQLLTDTDLESAADLTAERIAESVGGLPAARMHAAALAHAGVQELIGKLSEKKGPGGQEVGRSTGLQEGKG